jgi:hypothetical protein
MRDSHALPSLGSRPAPIFEHVPYLVTRIVPTMYHIILLPEEIGAEDHVDVARRQACL